MIHIKRKNKIFIVLAIVIVWLIYVIYRYMLILNFDDPYLLKVKLQLADIHKALQYEKDRCIIKGEKPKWLNSLSRSKEILFEGNDSTHILLTKGIVARDGYGGWQSLDNHFPYIHYKVHLKDQDVVFIYNPKDGTFKCLKDSKEKGLLCDSLLLP